MYWSLKGPTAEQAIFSDVKVVDTPFGNRPFRITVDPASDGSEVVNTVMDRVRTEMIRQAGV